MRKSPEGSSDFDGRMSELNQTVNDGIGKIWSDMFAETQFMCMDIRYSEKEGHMEFSIGVKNKGGNVFKLGERSKGFQWFVTFALLTTFRKNRKPHTLFLLDEPASNLHASAQEKVVDMINDLAKFTCVIYATHSEHLLDGDNIKSMYVVENKASEDANDPKIRCVPFAEYDGEDDCVRPFLDYMKTRIPDLLKQEKDKKDGAKKALEFVKNILTSLKGAKIMKPIRATLDAMCLASKCQGLLDFIKQ